MPNHQKNSWNNVQTLVMIDSAVEDFQSLVKVLLPSSKIIIIQPNYTELEQITHHLNKFTRLKSLHLISNGSPGCLYLGNSSLSLFSLNSYASQLKTWSVPNILLYGCNIAAGNIGREFTRRLHSLTSANIGASLLNLDDTSQGVSLQLNYFIGKIDSNLMILPSNLYRNLKAFQDL